jgi:hypothetical protein
MYEGEAAAVLRRPAFADLAPGHDLDPPEVRTGALQQAHLHDTLISAGGLHHKAAFPHHVGYGLFHVDVFARSRHGDERMPEVGRGDDHRAYVTVVQEFTKSEYRRAFPSVSQWAFCRFGSWTSQMATICASGCF